MNNLGSGQQVVTTVFNADSYDSLWTIKESERTGQPCRTGEAIRCGDTVRFEHNNTGKNLHSHSEYKAPLSNRQEVTGFGDDGSGDNGDDWQIMCNDMTSLGPTSKIGDLVYGDTLFFLKHMDSDRFLMTDRDNAFNN